MERIGPGQYDNGQDHNQLSTGPDFIANEGKLPLEEQVQQAEERLFRTVRQLERVVQATLRLITSR